LTKKLAVAVTFGIRTIAHTVATMLIQRTTNSPVLLDASPRHKRGRCKWQRIWYASGLRPQWQVARCLSALTAALPIHAALPSIGTKGCSFSTAAPTGVLALDPNGRVVRDSGPIEGLNPGGGNFGPDGRYYVGARSARTIMAFSIGLGATGEYVLPAGIVPFPRGFAFGRDGRLFLGSGIGPNGEGDDTIVAFAATGPIQASRLVTDPELSPLDLAIAQRQHCGFQRASIRSDAVTTVREYDALDGRLVRVFSPNQLAEFRKPRRLRFAPNGHLCCVAQDEVVAFDFISGECLGVIVRLPRLNGQALVFFP
jgi:hypothetical protein